MKHGLVIILLSISLFSCMEQGKIKVQNNVHNARLESINWGDIPIAYSLLPGQTSEEIDVEDVKDNFPKTYPLEFIMSRSGNQVYLKTKSHYELDYDQTLVIIVSDSTEVTNPM